MSGRAQRQGSIGKAAAKYVLLQLPGKVVLFFALLGLRGWLGWSWWVVGLVVGVWVLIDVALFPLVWRAYDPTAKGTAHSLVGLRGVAKERLAPDGYVTVRGELWRARCGRGRHRGRPAGAGRGARWADRSRLARAARRRAVR